MLEEAKEDILYGFGDFHEDDNPCGKGTRTDGKYSVECLARRNFGGSVGWKLVKRNQILGISYFDVLILFIKSMVLLSNIYLCKVAVEGKGAMTKRLYFSVKVYFEE
jgi:hypothetical protein